MPNRLACDRCHQQKLRCIKDDGQTSCNRCSIAGADCRFSQSMRGMRPQKTKALRAMSKTRSSSSPSRSSDPTPNNNSTLESIDPSALLWDSSLTSGTLLTPENRATTNDVDLFDYTNYNGPGLNLNSLQDTVVDGVSGVASPIPPPRIGLGGASQLGSTEHETTVLALERRLSHLSQQLREHASKVPPLSIWGDRAVHSRYDVMDFHIDGTFSLTEVAIDMGKRFTDFVRHFRHFTGPLGLGHRIDLSSLYLLLSCHNRVLDLWSLTFSHIRYCARESQAAGTPPVIRVPSVRIGSFPSSASTALDLHLSIMARSAIQLEKGTRTLIEEISVPSATVSPEGLALPAASIMDGNTSTHYLQEDLRSPFAVSLCHALLDRASEMVRNAEAIKRMIEQVAVRAGGEITVR